MARIVPSSAPGTDNGHLFAVAMYAGEVADTLRHGRGTYIFPNAYFKYTGDWKEGKMHGQGVLFFGDGSTLEGAWWPGTHHHGIGEFREGEICGHGVRRWSDGSTYRGQFEYGERHGPGVYYGVDGERYQGDWQHNQRHGHGEWSHGDVSYVGEFAHHQFHGQGTYDSPQKHYHGQWQHGQYDGPGQLDTLEGHHQGLFQQGHMISGQVHLACGYRGPWQAGRPRCPDTIMCLDTDTDQLVLPWQEPQQICVRGSVLSIVVALVQRHGEHVERMIHESGRMLVLDGTVLERTTCGNYMVQMPHVMDNTILRLVDQTPFPNGYRPLETVEIPILFTD